MRAHKRVPTALGMLMVLMTLLVGCSTLSPLSTEKALDGYIAKDILVVVSEAYSFKPGFVTHTLPAGTYTPVLEDDKGVYFQSPSKLLIGDLIGPSLADGGLFFKGSDLTDVYEYTIDNWFGRHTKWKLPSDFKFRVERKP